MGRIRFQDLDTEFILGFVLFKGFADSKKYKIPPDLSLKSTTKKNNLVSNGSYRLQKFPSGLQ